MLPKYGCLKYSCLKIRQGDNVRCVQIAHKDVSVIVGLPRCIHREFILLWALSVSL